MSEQPVSFGRTIATVLGVCMAFPIAVGSGAAMLAMIWASDRTAGLIGFGVFLGTMVAILLTLIIFFGPEEGE